MNFWHYSKRMNNEMNEFFQEAKHVIFKRHHETALVVVSTGTSIPLESLRGQTRQKVLVNKGL